MLKYLMILDSQAKYVEMNKSDSSERYMEVEKEFAKQIGKEERWVCINMMRLYNDQKIGNVYYTEEFVYSGACFRLLQTPDISDVDIENAKAHLRCNRDCANIKIIEVKNII